MAYSTTPTAKATLTLTTSGMSSSDTSINQTMNLHDIAHTLGCKRTTGLKRANGTNNSAAGPGGAGSFVLNGIGFAGTKGKTGPVSDARYFSGGGGGGSG